MLKKLKPGSKVIAGTILGRIGRTEQKMAPHMLFEVRPAGRGAPRIDPKPILDGWKLLESTAIYRAAGKNPFWGPDSKNPSIGQILLMSKEALQHRVLTDPAIDIYDCGRRDIQAGGIDRRVLATLEFLSASGLKPTVSALHCGHSFLTTSGNVSEHSSGNAVDIAAINGIPILGHQGPGSITDITIRRLLTLQGTMKPHQIISLMTFDGADNTLSLPDHNDHIHVGFQPLDGTDAKAGRQLNSRAQAEPVDQAHRPAGQDRQPDGAAQAVEVRAQGAEAGQQGPRRRVALFGFVQLEFPWALGPPDGRYVVRGHAAELEHVLVVSTLGAPERRWLRGRRRRPASPEPAPVATGRVTLVTAQPFYDDEAAESWLRAAGEDEAQAAVATLNRVLHMHRAATADPHVRELRREQAVVVRVGYGEGDQVADGRWVKALELPAARAADAPRRGAAPAGAPRRAARAAATPCWPARSSPCARARTSTRGAGARPRCSSTPRSPSRCPSSSRGRRAATSARAWPSCASCTPASAPPRWRRCRAASRTPTPPPSGTPSSASRPRCGRARPSVSTDRPSPSGRSRRSGGCRPPMHRRSVPRARASRDEEGSDGPGNPARRGRRADDRARAPGEGQARQVAERGST